MTNDRAFLKPLHASTRTFLRFFKRPVHKDYDNFMQWMNRIVES